MSTPRGIPSVTYLRISNSQSGWTDVVSDGPNSVTVLEADKVNIFSLSHLYLNLKSCIRLDFAAIGPKFLLRDFRTNPNALQ